MNADIYGGNVFEKKEESKNCIPPPVPVHA